MKRLMTGTGSTIITSISGGYGVVNIRTSPSGPVAVKESASSPASLQESTIARDLQGHRNVIPVHKVEIDGETVKIHMPVVNQTLLDLVQQFPDGMPLPRVLHIFWQLISVVEYVHARGIVHKDLKLENILVDDDDCIFLIDFGLSRYFTPGKKALRDALGSPRYAAPELWLERAYEGPSADIWSMGVVLFLLTTGFFPFSACTRREVIKEFKCFNLDFPQPLDRDSAFINLMRCFFKSNPDKRITLAGLKQHPWLVAHPDPLLQATACSFIRPSSNLGHLLSDSSDSSQYSEFDEPDSPSLSACSCSSPPPKLQPPPRKQKKSKALAWLTKLMK